MAKTTDNSFDSTLNEMKRLMNFSPITESNTNNYSSEIVEYKKMAADGKCYGIIRENNKYYIKVSDKTENPLKQDFDYVGGIGYKSMCENKSYNLAVQNLEFKLRSINEAKLQKGRIVDSFNPDAKETYIAEDRVEMSKELNRQREIMFKTSGILKEDLGYKPVLKITSTDADKTAKPFTDKVTAPKGTEVPSKGNIEPKKVGVPFNDSEVKPDMKADPSQAARKFKITGLQLKNLKAKLTEDAIEAVNPAQATTPVVEPITTPATPPVDPNAPPVPPVGHAADLTPGSKAAVVTEGQDINTRKMKFDVDKLSSNNPRVAKTLNLIKDKVYQMPPRMADYDEYLYMEDIIDLIGDIRQDYKQEKGFKYDPSSNSKVDLENLEDNLYTILDRNPIYQEVTKDPNGGVEGDEYDAEPQEYNDNSGFEDDVESIDIDGTDIFDEEKCFEIDEEELTEAILNIFGKVDSFGKEPMTMPGGGTRQYAIQKPKADGTLVTPEKVETELVAEPKDAKADLKPKDSIEKTKNYMDKVAESIIRDLKKKV